MIICSFRRCLLAVIVTIAPYFLQVESIFAQSINYPNAAFVGFDLENAHFSPNGNEIFGSYKTAAGPLHAFRWSGGTFTDLHPAGFTSSAIFDENNNGDIIGQVNNPIPATGAPNNLSVYFSLGQSISFGAHFINPPLGYYQFSPTHSARNGVVPAVLGTATDFFSGSSRGAVWVGGPDISILLPAQFGANQVLSYSDINSSYQVIASTQDPSTAVFQALRVQLTGPSTSIATLLNPPPGNVGDTSASAMNENGEIAGGFSDPIAGSSACMYWDSNNVGSLLNPPTSTFSFPGVVCNTISPGGKIGGSIVDFATGDENAIIFPVTTNGTTGFLVSSFALGPNLVIEAVVDIFDTGSGTPPSLLVRARHALLPSNSARQYYVLN